MSCLMGGLFECGNLCMCVFESMIFDSIFRDSDPRIGDIFVSRAPFLRVSQTNSADQKNSKIVDFFMHSCIFSTLVTLRTQ